MAQSPDLARSELHSRFTVLISLCARERLALLAPMIGKGRAVASAAKNREKPRSLAGQSRGQRLVRTAVFHCATQLPVARLASIGCRLQRGRGGGIAGRAHCHRAMVVMEDVLVGSVELVAVDGAATPPCASCSAPRGTLQGAVSRKHEHLPPGASRDGAIRDCAPARQTREKRPFHAAGRPARRLPIRPLRVERLQRTRRGGMTCRPPPTSASCPTPCSSGSRNARQATTATTASSPKTSTR